ncbi:hypothetical protein PLANPX_4963 [Lacipirellula parvula]|uniref:Uncharacterized protein n=1 Tax=Lacipirellula parvula TaxID=2650471 RepID=A0A5K7XJT8_9BACT|nr:hypothetical protein PLANPX_4963 [Lacipirellula parvula]
MQAPPENRRGDRDGCEASPRTRVMKYVSQERAANNREG